VNSAFYPSGVNEIPGATLGSKRGAFTCVVLQMTLCDLTWQVTLRISETDSHDELQAILIY